MNEIKTTFRAIASWLEDHDPYFEQFGKALNIFLCLLCLTIWIMPQFFSAELIFSTIALLAFEFILLHSAVFMPLSYWLFIPVYFLFAYFFNKAAPDNMIMITYLITVLNRVRYVFYIDGNELQGKTIVTGIFYFFYAYFPIMLICIVFQLLGLMPSFGLNESFLEAIEYRVKYRRRSDADPSTMMCFGFFYYLRILYLEYDRARKIETAEANKMTIAIIGRTAISQKLCKRLKRFRHNVYWVVPDAEEVRNDLIPDKITKQSPSEWLKNNKRVHLVGYDEIPMNTDFFINVTSVESLEVGMSVFGKEKIKGIPILDLSHLEYLSNKIFTEDEFSQKIKKAFPENPIIDLTTNMSCEGFIASSWRHRKRLVNLYGNDENALDKTRLILHQFGWKENKIIEIKTLGEIFFSSY